MDRWELYVKAQELHDEGKWVLVEDAEAELARLRAENEKLRSDVVWAVRHGVYCTAEDAIQPKWGAGIFYRDDEQRHVQVKCDGTDAGLLDAVRRAREGTE